ncbi:MAG: DNA/RNA helicase domain-containing protein [Phycisphaerales bacterium]
MLLDVETFRQRTEYDLDGLVGELQAKTSRATPAEARAWRNSLPALSKVLSNERLRGFHLHLGMSGSVVVEYRLPSSPSWADVVLLGSGASGPEAVVVELKDWDTRGDTAADAGALVERSMGEVLHPSAQVEGYVEYCTKFHSAVQQHRASVHGCVYFTYASDASVYRKGLYSELVQRYPVFARNAADVESLFPDYLSEHLRTPNRDFAHAFEEGFYHQDRGFVGQVAAAIRGGAGSPFVLLDQQRLGFEVCRSRVQRVLAPAYARARPHRRKSVVVIEGPPGSGKSAIAAHLWAALGSDARIDGSVVLTTTSGAQRSNWEQLFVRAARDAGAQHVVQGANQYNPGLSVQWVSRMRDAGLEATVQSWKANLERFAREGGPLRCRDDQYAVSIVDEAHALIDPTAPGADGVSPSGWVMHAGPQAWHVIRASRVSVFLLDPDQSYRDNETTSVDRIREYAREFDADFDRVSLAGSQFRCGGSTEYLDWIDTRLLASTRSAIAPATRASMTWRRSAGGPMDFEIVGTPAELETALRGRLAEGRTARLLASYARPWRTQHALSPHDAAEADRDFVLSYEGPRGRETWSRIWNFAPDQDYARFIQATEGSAIARDPLCEVGCPYVVRGFDFDFVGLLWLDDLVWRGDRWEANPASVHESAWRLTRARARRGEPGAQEELVRRLLRGYRILLSRAMRGVYVWFQDEETRDHVRGVLEARASGR